MNRLCLVLLVLIGPWLAACGDNPETARKKLAEKQLAVSSETLMAKTKEGNTGTGDAKLLVIAGADPNARQANGMTALMSAVFNGQAETARLLIERGADVNASAKGFTALRLAVEKNSPDMVKLLLANGARPDLRPESGASALDKARDGGNRQIIELLEARVAKK
jgi:ankyrin repeat protein